MDEATGTGGPQVNETEEPRSPEEIRSDIKETREDLGDTAEALAGKADVKAQAKAKFEGLKQTAQEKTRQFTAKAKDGSPESASAGAEQVSAMAKENPVPVAIGAALIGGVVIGWLLSK
jgi:ElaB/YqjD/DUF883 family membrane-anchored ribosome-binding protein